MSELTSNPIRVEMGALEAGQRLDRVLAGHMDGASRNRLKALILEGQVTRGGETIKDPSIKVKPGECYWVTLPAPVSAVPAPQDIPLDVVFEDDDVIVVNKPAGMVVHPAAGHGDGTLVNALLHHCGSSLAGIGGVMRPGIVHRIDKDTSGLLVAAKNEQAQNALAKQFSAHTIERAYLALIWGAPRPLLGTIDAALIRAEGNRKKVTVARDPDRGRARHAITHYKMLKRYGPEHNPLISLIQCRLETGRTHQIRVHMSHIGHAIVGDPLYGRGLSLISTKEGSPQIRHLQTAIQDFSRQALHASILGFTHPATKKSLRFEIDLPPDIKGLISELELL